MPAIEPDKQQTRSRQAMMTHKSTGSKPVCILLSGAELADLDLSSVELYMGSSGYDSTTRVELRRKSGLAAGTMANSLPWLSGSSSSSQSSSSRSSSSSFSSSCHYSSSLSNDGGPLSLFDSSWASADGWNSQRCLRLLHRDETAQEHGLAPALPIVLKSKGVLEMEKLEMVAAATGKPAATAAAAAARKNNTETAAPITGPAAAVVTHRRPPKTSQPLPLPLPPPSPSSSKHRRHTSIDLRSSPAAKFLVQLMPWEVPSPPLRGNHDASTLSPAPHCFVPFKWEEAPGRPKPAVSFAATSTVHPRLLRLPPRLVVQDGHRKTMARESSPTSILDPEWSCSSSSPPQIAPKSSSSPRLKALWSWSILDLVMGKKKQPENSSDEDFDPFQGCGRRRKTRVVSMKKQRGGGARNHGNHSLVDGKITASTPGSSYFLPSPATFTWFDSPNHHRYVRKRRWASRKIAATCRALKRMAVGGRQQKSQTPATMYRPLLCRVDVDSAAFACSSSSL